MEKETLTKLLMLALAMGVFSSAQAHEFDPAHAPRGKDSIKILHKKLPKDKDVIYVSWHETKSSVGDSDGHDAEPIAAIKAMRNDGTGKDSILEVEHAPIFSIHPSPDGRSLLLTIGDLSSENPHLAHTWLNSHIWLYKDGEVSQLTRGMVRDSDMVWPSSGGKIYFTRSAVSPIEGDVLKAAEGNIWSMNPDGSDARQLTFSSKVDVVNITPVPTPDGRKINFTTNRNSKWQIFSMNPDGSNQKVFIGDGMQGSWSRDGQAFVYLDDSPGDAYLADRRGKKIKKLTREGKLSFSPTWSPDGRHLLYSRLNEEAADPAEHKENLLLAESPPPEKEGPLFDIWKMSVDKPEVVEQLTREGSINNFPFWVTLSPPAR